MKKLVLYAAAAMSLLSAVLHISFWKILKWPGSLQELDIINRGVIQILNIVVFYMFLYISAFTIIIARKGNTDLLSRSLLLFACGVPCLRILFGFHLFGYSESELIVWIKGAITAALYALSFYLTRDSGQKKFD